MRKDMARVLWGGCLLIALNVALLAVSGASLFGKLSRGRVMSSLDVGSVINTPFLIDFFWFVFSFSLLNLLVAFVLYVVWRCCSLSKFRGDSRVFYLLLLFFFLLIYLWNMVLFPWSALAGGAEKGSVFLWGLVSGTCAWLLVIGGGVGSGFRGSKLIVGVLGLGLLVGLWDSSSKEIVVTSARPNIIIIGFDSLRPEMPSERYMPNLNGYLQQSVRFSDAVTPLPRTFPSWMSLLTGVNPVKHGARFNLMPYSLINHDFKSLPKRLKEEGYQTLYAMDEKRFANIDQRYGFDHLVGPKIGVGDFLFGFLSDLPVLNMVRQFPLSEPFFPYVYSNRALSASYMGEDFVGEVEDGIADLDAGLPAFMVVHFCEPHWPYAYVSGKERQTGWLSKFNGQGNFQNYMKSLPRADEQFGKVITALRDAGRLENALVFFVSDHGEGFARDAVTFSSAVGGRPFELSAYGHGTNVVQRFQFQVLMAYQVYRNGKLVSIPSSQERDRVSLLDIYPTVLEYLGIELPKTLDGYSLIGREKIPERNFFVETDFNVSAVLNGQIDADEAFAQGASAYRVESNGYVSLRPDKIGQIMRQKEYSVLSGDKVLAFGDYGKELAPFRLFDYSAMTWRPIEGEDGDPSIREMQLALCRQFASDPLMLEQHVCRSARVADAR